MSKENIQAFFQKADQEPVLKEKACAILERSPEEVPAALAELSKQVGLGFTAEEFAASLQGASLSDTELDAVAGGGRPPVKGVRVPGQPTLWEQMVNWFN
jgi:predicted ribosomally synthesized peptide with nif11-like leader